MAGMDRRTGKLLTGAAHIEQSIMDILRTRKGTRYPLSRLAGYGSDVMDYIDAPITDGLRADIAFAAADAVHRWEDRVILARVLASQPATGRLVLDIAGTETETGRAFLLREVRL